MTNDKLRAMDEIERAGLTGLGALCVLFRDKDAAPIIRKALGPQADYVEKVANDVHAQAVAAGLL